MESTYNSLEYIESILHELNSGKNSNSSLVKNHGKRSKNTQIEEKAAKNQLIFPVNRMNKIMNKLCLANGTHSMRPM